MSVAQESSVRASLRLRYSFQSSINTRDLGPLCATGVAAGHTVNLRNRNSYWMDAGIVRYAPVRAFGVYRVTRYAPGTRLRRVPGPRTADTPRTGCALAHASRVCAKIERADRRGTGQGRTNESEIASVAHRPPSEKGTVKDTL